MAAIIINNGYIKGILVYQLNDENMVCLEINWRKLKWILINAYFQFSGSIDIYLNKLDNILRAYSGQNIIIAADFNAKSVLWYGPVTDEKGEKLEDPIFSFQLMILNRPGFPPTFCNRAGAKGYTDITLASPGIAQRVLEWRVEDSLTMTDHDAILYSLTYNGLQDGIYKLE